MKYIFIINPNAGGKHAAARIHELESRLRALPAQHDFEIHLTTKAFDAENIARSTSDRYNSEAIVAVVGGDGTLNEVANGLAGTDTPLLVLPAGRGNDFSRSLYAAENREADEILKAIRLFEADDISDYIYNMPIDLLHVRAEEVSYPDQDKTLDELNRYCINVASIGYDSKAVICADRISRRFSFQSSNVYFLGALLATLEKMHFRFHVRVDDQEYKDRRYSLAAVCNARFYGSGFQPNPDGLLNDGQLEMLISKPINILHVARMAKKFKEGRISEISILEPFKGKKVSVESAEWDPLIATLDGEAFYCRRMQIEAQAAKLKLILPRAFPLPATISS